MPHFDEFYANKLRGGLGVVDADSVLDLRGASREKAAASIQDMLERSRFAQVKAVAIRLDPPVESCRKSDARHELRLDSALRGR